MDSKINRPQEQIHQRFKYFGAKHLESRKKCIGLLPRIFKEKIYEKKGFNSIFEYAAKLAGLSQDQVRRALNLHESFKELPVLRGLLETGEVSVNKLARIASIATSENDGDLANHVRVLPQKAIETFVKDFRLTEKERTREEAVRPDGFQKALFDEKSVRAHNTREQREHAHDKNRKDTFAHSAKIIELKLSAKNLEKLLELQEKGIDINEIIETALRKREEGIAEAKNKKAQGVNPTDSRYIPAGTRRIIDAEQGDKCAMPGCGKKAQVIHHELPFAMTRTHDPNYLKKLCRAHHEIAHGINLKIYEIKKGVINSG